MPDPLTPSHVASEFAAAGQPLSADELDELDTMSADELGDELTYLSDFQG